MSIIAEVQAITADQVAKKQDTAKINFPKIIDKIKAQAALGNSEAILNVSEMNEYDKNLLEAEGFVVRLREREKVYDPLPQYQKFQSKEWRITW